MDRSTLKTNNHRGGAVYSDPSGGLKISPWLKNAQRDGLHAPSSSELCCDLTTQREMICVHRHQLRQIRSREPLYLSTLPTQEDLLQPSFGVIM